MPFCIDMRLSRNFCDHWRISMSKLEFELELSLTELIAGNGDAPMSIVSCEKCGTKNRVETDAPAGRVAKCGKCGALLTRAGTDKPLVVTDQTFSQEILNGAGVVLLDCWAPWCGPCRM